MLYLDQEWAEPFPFPYNEPKVWYEIHADERHFNGRFMAPHTTKKKAKFRRDSDDSEIVMSAKEELQAAVREGVRRAAAKARAVKALYKAFPDEKPEIINNIVDNTQKAMVLSYYNRYKRFKRKAFLYQYAAGWNYFVTVTRDDKLFSDEEVFRDRVDKCFSNLAFRRGWRMMGVWERGSDNDRLHFHCLLHVPEGEMVGEIKTIKSRSTKRNKWEETQISTFFTNRFGRTEFQDLDEHDLLQRVGYILKYMEKSGERIRYSRGIPTTVVLPLAEVKDIALQYMSGQMIRAIVVDGRVTRDAILTYTNKQGELVRESLRQGDKVGEALAQFRARGAPPPEEDIRERQISAFERLQRQFRSVREAQEQIIRLIRRKSNLGAPAEPVKVGVQLACI